LSHLRAGPMIKSIAMGSNYGLERASRLCPRILGPRRPSARRDSAWRRSQHRLVGRVPHSFRLSANPASLNARSAGTDSIVRSGCHRFAAALGVSRASARLGSAHRPHPSPRLERCNDVVRVAAGNDRRRRQFPPKRPASLGPVTGCPVARDVNAADPHLPKNSSPRVMSASDAITAGLGTMLRTRQVTGFPTENGITQHEIAERVRHRSETPAVPVGWRARHALRISRLPGSSVRGTPGGASHALDPRSWWFPLCYRLILVILDANCDPRLGTRSACRCGEEDLPFLEKKW